MEIDRRARPACERTRSQRFHPSELSNCSAACLRRSRSWRRRSARSCSVSRRGDFLAIYAAETWPARITGSGSSGDDLTKLTVGHDTEETDDPLTVPGLTVTTAICEFHDDVLAHARQALEMWVYDDHNRPKSEGLSDAATTLWFAARRRDRRAAAMGAIQTELMMTIDGTPQPFLRLSTPTGRWVAVRRHDDLIITIAARDIDPTALTLEPIADPAARLLGPEPEEMQDHPA